MTAQKCVLIGGGLLALPAVLAWQLTRADTAPAPPGALSGIASQYFDPSVRPQDDFYRYVNGKWLDATDIPADLPAYEPWRQAL